MVEAYQPFIEETEPHLECFKGGVGAIHEKSAPV